MYTLGFIIASIPLFFSHFFPFLAEYIAPSGSFERVKVLLFLTLLLIACFEVAICQSMRLSKTPLRRYILLLLFLIFPFIGYFLYFSGGYSLFFWGSYEKHHGYFFFLGLVIFSFLLSLMTHREHERLLRISLITAVGVGFFALLEFVNISLFFPMSNGKITWELGRTISTLGNPNYVAGYLLIHFPLIIGLRSSEKYIVFMMLFLALLTTGSYIGIGLLFGYGLCILPKAYIASPMHRYLIYATAIVIALICMIVWLQESKMLSFVSRFILMKDVSIHMISDIGRLLFGYGPDSLITYYQLPRSDSINLYFPKTSAIDSSHNILLDALYVYGGVLGVTILGLIWRQWKKIDHTAQSAFLLGMLFFSLNVIVLAPMLVILLFISHARTPSGKDRNHR